MDIPFDCRYFEWFGYLYVHIHNYKRTKLLNRTSVLDPSSMVDELLSFSLEN